MADPDPRAKRHIDYVQLVPLGASSPQPGAPSLQTFAAEQLRTNFSEAEPDGYIRITKTQADELLPVIDDYVDRHGPLQEADATLVAELRDVLEHWDSAEST